MELGAHDVVVVASQDADAVSRLPVPDADGLIVRGADNPRILVVEKRGAYVVQMAEEREQALALLVVPDFDLVIVTARDEQRPLTVERDTANRTFKKSIQKRKSLRRRGDKAARERVRERRD